MIRQAKSSDLNFIKKTWFETFESSAFGRSLSPGIYGKHYAALIDQLVTDSGILVLADDETEDVILAWCAYEGRTLHYVFVREDFRGLGYARDLLSQVPTLRAYSHRTIDWQRISPRLAKSWDYNPFYAFSKARP